MYAAEATTATPDYSKTQEQQQQQQQLLQHNVCNVFWTYFAASLSFSLFSWSHFWQKDPLTLAWVKAFNRDDKMFFLFFFYNLFIDEKPLKSKKKMLTASGIVSSEKRRRHRRRRRQRRWFFDSREKNEYEIFPLNFALTTSSFLSHSIYWHLGEYNARTATL